jgi:lipid II:glycine glycyltransferase (peptidoglycan interpeptide bridge formation enzyme)
MSSIKIEVASRSDRELWNRIIDKSPHGSIFHTWEWLEIAEKYSGMRLYPLIAYKGTTPVGAFPVFVKKIGPFSAVFSPPPRLAIPFLGPVVVDYNNLKQNKKDTMYHGLVSGALEFIKEMRPVYTCITSPPNLIDARQFLWSGFKAKPVYNYFFDISRGKEYLWRRLKKARRKNITKTGKLFEFRVGEDKSDFDFVVNGVFSRAEEQNIRLRLSRKYLNALYRRLNGNVKVHVVARNGERVVGIINLTHGNYVYSWLGNFKKKIKGYSPNDLLLWKSIEHSIDKGYTHFFEIGANISRLVKFKAQFNPDLLLNFKFTKGNLLLEACAEVVQRMRL